MNQWLRRLPVHRYLSEQRWRRCPQLSLVLLGLLMPFPLQAADAPDVGDPAPDFRLPGSDGQTYTLSELRGGWVVVAFFPKAFTGG